MVWETSWAAVVFAPDEVLLVCLGAGLLFHIGSAAVMGLDAFVLPFAALYAPVYAAHTQINDALGRPLSGVLAVVLGLLIIAALTCVALASRRPRQPKRGLLPPAA